MFVVGGRGLPVGRERKTMRYQQSRKEGGGRKKKEERGLHTILMGRECGLGSLGRKEREAIMMESTKAQGLF